MHQLILWDVIRPEAFYLLRYIIFLKLVFSFCVEVCYEIHCVSSSLCLRFLFDRINHIFPQVSYNFFFTYCQLIGWGRILFFFSRKHLFFFINLFVVFIFHKIKLCLKAEGWIVLVSILICFLLYIGKKICCLARSTSFKSDKRSS